VVRLEYEELQRSPAQWFVAMEALGFAREHACLLQVEARCGQTA